MDERDPEPMEGMTPRTSEGTGETMTPVEGDTITQDEPVAGADLMADIGMPEKRGVVVASFMGTIVLRAKAGEAPAVPTIVAVERAIVDALDLAGYAATADLTRTDR